jgi:hypothetical protein
MFTPRERVRFSEHSFDLLDDVPFVPFIAVLEYTLWPVILQFHPLAGVWFARQLAGQPAGAQ